MILVIVIGGALFAIWPREEEVPPEKRIAVIFANPLGDYGWVDETSQAFHEMDALYPNLEVVYGEPTAPGMTADYRDTLALFVKPESTTL